MTNRPLLIAAASAFLGALTAFGSGGAAVQAKDSVTFTEDVAPIVFNHCATCHRPGEAAPFSLLTYDDVKRRGTLIAKAVASRAMPPWKAVASDYPYHGDRRLSDRDIETVRRWVEAGMPEGDPAQLPAMPA